MQFNPIAKIDGVSFFSSHFSVCILLPTAYCSILAQVMNYESDDYNCRDVWECMTWPIAKQPPATCSTNRYTKPNTANGKELIGLDSDLTKELTMENNKNGEWKYVRLSLQFLHCHCSFASEFIWTKYTHVSCNPLPSPSTNNRPPIPIAITPPFNVLQLTMISINLPVLDCLLLLIRSLIIHSKSVH